MADEPGSRRSGRRWVVGLALVAVAAALIWSQLPRDTSAPGRVEPGALQYATRGFEEVSILGGARHEYPDRTGVLIEREGCVRQIVWRPLRDRLTAYELCGGRLRSIREVHSFFGRRDERLYRCTAASSLRHGWRCSFDGTTEVARGGPVRTGRQTTGKIVHVQLETRIEGNVEGSGSREFWLRSDGVPVRIAATNENSTGTPIGRLRYTERYELKLLPGQLGHRPGADRPLPPSERDRGLEHQP